MKHLIIADVHHQWRVVDKILNNLSGQFDKVVFLGDFFDHFKDDSNISINTAKWLDVNLDNPNYIFIRSNHDTTYMFPRNKYLYCSGFTMEKSKAILQNIDILKLRGKTKLFHRINSFLLSHAGISRTLIEYLARRGEIDGSTIKHSAESVESHITPLLSTAEQWCEDGRVHPLYDVGFIRGGRSEVGGATWCDLSEFQPIPNIVQIFGHTPIYPASLVVRLCTLKEKKAPYLGYKNADNYFPQNESRKYDHMFANGCGIGIDSHLHGFAILDDTDNKLQVFRIKFDTKEYYDRNITGIEQLWERTF